MREQEDAVDLRALQSVSAFILKALNHNVFHFRIVLYYICKHWTRQCTSNDLFVLQGSNHLSCLQSFRLPSISRLSTQHSALSSTVLTFWLKVCDLKLMMDAEYKHWWLSDEQWCSGGVEGALNRFNVMLRPISSFVVCFIYSHHKLHREAVQRLLTHTVWYWTFGQMGSTIKLYT